MPVYGGIALADPLSAGPSRPMWVTGPVVQRRRSPDRGVSAREHWAHSRFPLIPTPSDKEHQPSRSDHRGRCHRSTAFHESSGSSRRSPPGWTGCDHLCAAHPTIRSRSTTAVMATASPIAAAAFRPVPVGTRSNSPSCDPVPRWIRGRGFE